MTKPGGRHVRDFSPPKVNGFLTGEAIKEKLVLVEVTVTTWIEVGTFGKTLE